jgi:hypothetical protein
MKIRNGFVSNSSSSSFVIIGSKVKNLSYITDEKIDKANDSFYIHIRDFDDEGETMFFVDDVRTLHLIQDLEDAGADIGDVFEIIADDDEDLRNVVFPTDRPTRAFSITKDQCSPHNFESAVDLLSYNDKFDKVHEKHKAIMDLKKSTKKRN